MFLWSGPLFAFAAFLIWFGVRRGLAPLNAAARDANSIDMDSLNQRFPENEMPIEVLPFVKAVNEALTRLDAGVARQGRFTANAAHELRTPIAILDARADAIDDVSLKQEMKRDVRRMQMVVDQLLLLARRTGNEKEEAPPIDLVEAVQVVAGHYLPVALANDRRLELNAPTAPISGRIGRWELECVVGNLIDNALRAEPQNGCVIICLGADRTIEVTDHGEGVAAERSRSRFSSPSGARAMRRQARASASPSSGRSVETARRANFRRGDAGRRRDVQGDLAAYRRRSTDKILTLSLFTVSWRLAASSGGRGFKQEFLVRVNLRRRRSFG